MLNHQKVRLPAFQSVREVLQPFSDEVPVRGIHDRDLFIHNHIGIVGHSLRYDVHTFKQIDFMIVDADVTDIIGDVYPFFLSFRVIRWESSLTVL